MMTNERAIELVRWGRHYAKPRCKNDAEYREALDVVASNPDTWDQISWSERKEQA